MNKKLLIVFALGVIVYVVWKKSKETSDSANETPDTPPTPSNEQKTPFVKSAKVGAIRGGQVKKVGLTR
jgi:hypothetical protein